MSRLQEISMGSADGEDKVIYGKKLYELALGADSVPLQAQALSVVGQGFSLLGTIDSATWYNFLALQKAEQLENPILRVRINNSLAYVYMSSENHLLAIKSFLKGLEEARLTVSGGFEYDVLDTASTYNNLGELYNYQGKFDSAMWHYEVALADYRRMDDRHGEAYVIGNIGTVYAQTNEHDLAKDYIDSAVNILSGLGDMYPIAIYLTYMSDIYKQAGDEKRALAYLDESLAIAQLHALKEQIRDAHQALSAFYQDKSQYDSAFYHQRLYYAYKDSIENVDNVQRMAEMRADYEVSQKQTEVDLLNEENKNQQLIGVIMAGGILFTIASTVFLYRRSKERRRVNQQLRGLNEEVSANNEEIKAINADLSEKQKALQVAYELIQEEQEKSEALLLNILPEATAKELKETGKAQPRHYNRVSIIFTDFKGFTQLAEKVSPEEVVEELNYCYKAFDRLCKQYNIEKIKTIGDAYMAAGGIPEANATNPVDAVHCALAMIEFMEDWKADKVAQGLPVWELRLGIHTGEIIAGVVGESKFAYDIWGDTVNLAARMESSGEPGRINISGDTYELVKDYFDCEHRGKVYAKNKGEVDMYFVNGAKR